MRLGRFHDRKSGNVMPPLQPRSSESTRWQDWLDAHGRLFFLYARQQTRGEDDAKDVFQDALVEAWRKSPGRVPDKALVLATIRRRAIDLGRATERRSSRERRVGEDVDSWFCNDFSRSDTHSHLNQAISLLPDLLRETLVLRIWADLSFPDIARLTRVPVSTATSRYRYALERLRAATTELQP